MGKHLLLLLASFAIVSAQQSVVVRPGSDLQAIIDAFPEGTIFAVTPGTYRLERVVPKHRNQFLAQPGAVFSGARLLSPRPAGPYWVAEGRSRPLPAQQNGTCDPLFPMCRLRDDVYLNDVPLTRVFSLDQLAPGKWFADPDANLLYLADDPSGRVLEQADTEVAFAGPAQGVRIRGLVIEKYATPAQQGAIYAPASLGARGWIIEDNEIRLNHGLGLTLHPGMTVRRNRIHTNGQLGAGGVGEGISFEENELYGNNYAHYYAGWEAGGAKFAITRGLIVRGNNVHHNAGPGLWTDIDNIDSLYEDNIVEYNDREGIVHEISYAAVIRNNIVRFNGRKRFTWLWGSQILIQNSQNVLIEGNSVQVADTGGNGISLIQQYRGPGLYGPYLTRNNAVRDNTIVYDGLEGMSGQVADFDRTQLTEANNQFDRNRYRFKANPQRWFWVDEKDWPGLQASGQEPNGRIE